MSRPCIFCGAQHHRIELSTELGVSLLCTQCGGVENQCKRAMSSYTTSYYSNNYFAIEEQQLARFTRYLKLIQPLANNCRILDVGCGTGMFLKAAYALGYKTSTGIDVSADALDIAKQKLGSTDVSLELSSAPLTGQFGVVAFMDSLAHVANMEESFAKIVSLNLIANGLVIIKTPKYNKAYSCYGILLGRLLSFVGKSAFVSRQIFFLPARNVLFTKKALDTLTSRCGLSEVFVLIEPDYVRVTERKFGLKARVVDFFLRGVSDFIRGGNQSVIIVTQKRCSSSVSLETSQYV